MSSVTKNNFILISIILLFVVSSYLIKSFSFFLNFKKEEAGQPINYDVLESREGLDLDKFDSNFISLSDEMIEIYERHNFTVNNFINGTTKKIIVFSSLPDDFMQLEPPHLRKDLFIRTILPIIYIENKKILNERKKILNWWTETEGEEISREFWPEWLRKISLKYNYKNENLGELLAKVDIIPISLSMAQAISESSWGSSNYAREGNAVFGSYTQNIQDVNVINNSKSDNFSNKQFASLSQSVAAYFKNINTNNELKNLREKRKKLRMEGKIITGIELVEYIEISSNAGKQYASSIRKLIEENNFKKFDNLVTLETN